MGVIYKLVNLVNGKIYVGQTRQKLSKRLYPHQRGKKRGVDGAIQKYSWKNFSYEILEECPVEMLNEREIFWIAELNSKAPNGYNLTDGGGYGKNIVVTKETRAKMSESLKAKNTGSPSLYHQTFFNAIFCIIGIRAKCRYIPKETRKLEQYLS